MEVVWQASPGEPRRKRASKACDGCQRRKKRCNHLGRPQRNFQPYSIPSPSISRSTTARDISRIQNPSGADPQSPEPARVGDYHPESILAELSASPAELNAQRQPADDVPNPVTSHSNVKSLRQSQSWQYESLRFTSLPISANLKAYLVETGAFRALPRSTQDGLVTTYITSIDCILPVLDGSDILRKYANDKLSPLLVNAMCLLACKAAQAGPYLRLTENGPLLSPSEFAKTLYSGLDIAMRMDLEPDRLVRIQILALMSQYHDGRGGVRDASARLSQAIHDAWVLTLHYDIPVHRDQTQCRYIWWTLRALDRLNACLQGCPPMISDRDSQTPPPPPGHGYRSDVASMMYRLGDLQDDVIETYRPNSEKLGRISLQDFPSLRQIAGEVDFEAFPESHRNYLELWYFVMALLYCRHSNAGSPEYEFRVECASRIEEITSIEKHATLPPLPLITYAVSMSLAVAYQVRGDNQTNHQTADRDLQARFSILESLSKNDWKARQMARLARRVIPSLKSKNDSGGAIQRINSPILHNSQQSISDSHPNVQASDNTPDLPITGDPTQHDSANPADMTTHVVTSPGIQPVPPTETLPETLPDDIDFDVSLDDMGFPFSEFDQYMTEVFNMGEHTVPS